MPGGQSSEVVSNVGLSSKSLVLATAQKNVAGVYVQAAVPDVAAKTITIYLNKSVGASYPVAWMIVERPEKGRARVSFSEPKPK